MIELDVRVSLGRAWSARVHSTPDRTALIFDEQRWSYRDLGGATSAIAALLEGYDIIAGDRVVLLMDNGPIFLAAFFACQLLGVIPVPASPKSSPERIAYLSQDCAASRILHEASLAARSRTLHQAQPYAGLLLEIGWYEATELRSARTVPANCCAFIQYTSGSTGKAKGVMVSHAAVLGNIRGFCSQMALGEHDVFASLLPLFHDMGLVCFGLAPLLLGYPLVLHLQESLSLYRWLDSIGRHRATITGAPDSLLHIANRVVADPENYDLSSLRILICGSEPVRRDSVERFGQRFDVLRAIKPAYGMAELTLCATLTPADAPLRIDARGNVASGKAIPGVTIWIRGETGVATRQPGTVGEILVESGSRMTAYWNQPEASRETIGSDGCVATGDVGYLDGDGYLYVIGRSKNLLMRGGEKFSPHDLETAASALPSVRRAGVVQLQDGESRIIGVIEVDRMVLGNADTLRDLAQRFRQAAHQRAGIGPDVCWFVPGGRIPMTENGKMQHAALRQLIETGALQPDWSDVAPEAGHAATAV